MIRFRPFQNSDPPSIVRIWNAQLTNRYLLSRLTEPLLDQFVLSKLYFDPAGLIVAEEGQELLGFVHAGWGPAGIGVSRENTRDAKREYENVTPEKTAADPSLVSGKNGGRGPGCICLAYSAARVSDRTLTHELLQQAEQYLRERGAEECFGGAHGRIAPFYLGLYGGSELPGILESDEHHTRLFLEADYEPLQKRQVWSIQLKGFRAPMSRELLQLRRQFRVELAPPTRPKDWWEACRIAHHEQAEFRLLTPDGSRHVASLTIWDLEPLAGGWGVSAVGLVGWQETEAPSGKSYELLLLSEVMKQLQSQGIARVETQVAVENQWAQGVLRELGFQQIDLGVVYRKP